MYYYYVPIICRLLWNGSTDLANLSLNVAPELKRLSAGPLFLPSCSDSNYKNTVETCLHHRVCQS